MEHSSNKSSSTERLVAIGLGLLAVLSPLYIDRTAEIDADIDDETTDFSLFLPILLLILILAIALSRCFDQRFTRFDPYLIYRICGSSGGIVGILMVLALVLKFKAN